MSDELRDWDVYNNLIEKYTNSVVIVSDQPITVYLSDIQKGTRIIMEKGNTKLIFTDGKK